MSVQYTEGCSVHWGMSLSTQEVFSTQWSYHEYTEGVQYSGGYHDECGGYYEYSGVTQYTGGCHEYTGGHHDECGEIS